MIKSEIPPCPEIVSDEITRLSEVEDGVVSVEEPFDEDALEAYAKLCLKLETLRE